ncbi:FAD binding domain-containing protein [Alkalilimnicola ehrlichii]|uniref:FAD binding domain-containing protein n=1 Tax=Alkalilimnicola ehrlichii TaxID=351052 RepID=UPI002163CBB7|nr:FAD binding domain-containing protein [Alkalilimnicola ehrlichii]
MDALATTYAANPDAVLLAGGTDIGLWVTKQLRELPKIIYIGNVAELKSIGADGDRLRIGAAVPLAKAFSTLLEYYPELNELRQRFASSPIRNAGTLCGNIANGSPIGDSMPILLALGASVRLRRGEYCRELALDDFYLGYQQNALAHGEFIEAVHIPLPRPGRRVATYKVSKRNDQDISAVCGAYAVVISNGKVVSARIAYGGMAAIPKRARATEAALVGNPWTQATINTAINALEGDFQPISDMRAGREYRRLVAGNLLQRFYLESASPDLPLRLQTLTA